MADEDTDKGAGCGECRECGGTGKLPLLTSARPCGTCGGTGRASLAPPPDDGLAGDVEYTTHDAAGRIAAVSYRGGKTVYYTYYDGNR